MKQLQFTLCPACGYRWAEDGDWCAECYPANMVRFSHQYRTPKKWRDDWKPCAVCHKRIRKPTKAIVCTDPLCKAALQRRRRRAA